MKYYYFTKISDDGRRWTFRKKFYSAFHADRWAMKCFHSWITGKISYRIIFDC